MVSLPGSYPLDDSAPATPEEPISQRQQSHQNRNKFHKPNDPRSHQQSDSGVAGFGLHEADSSKAHDPSGNEYLDATGGDYYTYQPIKPSSVVESQVIHHTAPQDSHRDTQKEPRPRETQSNEQPRTFETDKPSSSKSAESSAKQVDKSESAPYWGDLPKGQRGGIYNTVTGHGSPKDDHDQHHHITERSAARERSHIPGPVGAAADKTTSRVYNTVTGHGSRDQESKRKITPPSPAATGGATVSSTAVVHDAPLVGIPEEKPLNTGLSSSAIPSSDLGMGFLPETAAQDDAKLLARPEERARSHEDSRTGPSAAWATEMSGPKATEPSHPTSGPKSDTMHQRVFPLGSSSMTSGEDAVKPRYTGPHDTNLAATDISTPPKEQPTISRSEHASKPSPDDHRGRDAMIAGAGVAGTGITASELTDRRQSDKESRRSISEDSHGRKRLSKADKKHKDTSSSSGSDYSNQKDKRSPEGRKSRDEGAPKTEKMSHRILGIFGLNKDDKAQQSVPATEPAKEASPSRHSPLGRHKDEQETPDRSTTESGKDKSTPQRGKSPRHSSDKKEAAVGAAAGIGVTGLVAAGKKDAERAKHYQEPTEASRHHEHPKQSKDVKATGSKPDQRPVSQGAAQPAVKTSGPMGSTPQGPIGPEQQPPAPAGKPGTDSTVPNFSQPNPTDRSKAVPVAAGLGAAAVGAGASQAAHKHDEPAQSQPTAAPSTTSAPHTFENPRVPPTHDLTEPHGPTTVVGHDLAWAATQKHPVVTNKPGEYNTLSSGTASGVATDTLPHPPSTNQGHGKGVSSKYDTLASGTASGVKSQHAPQGPITQKPGDYNSLHSGTASAVKSHHEPEGSVAQKSREYRTLHSGTASGVATATATATAIGAGAYAHKEKESTRRGSTGTYNKLTSGTPSGVVVEPRRHRASEDQGQRSGDYKLFPKDSLGNQMHPSRAPGSDAGSSNTQQSYQLPPPPIPVSSVDTSKENENNQAHKHASGPGFVSVPITSRPPRHDQHQQQQPKSGNTTTTDTADRVRRVSPEVMPSAYTTSTPRTGNMSHSAPYGDASTADQVRHMSPEVMPSAYTTSAPRSAHLPDSTDLASAGQGPTAHSHSTDVHPALAAATGAWASSGGPSVVGGSGWPAMMNRGPGGKTVLHTCEHCGKENDITAYVASHQAI